MTDSILTSTKKMCGVAETDVSFDLDIIMYINSALTQLHDLGIGPANGFMVEDKTATWTDLLGPEVMLFNDVKTYVYMVVRLMFDPPSTSFGIKAMEDQIAKHSWMINVRREGRIAPVATTPEDTTLDGGAP